VGRQRNKEALIRYSVLVPESVDARLRQMQKDAGESGISDTVRRVLKDAADGGGGAAVGLSGDLASAVELACTLSGMTAEQVVSNVLRRHLGPLIEELRASDERLKAAMTPGKAAASKR